MNKEKLLCEFCSRVMAEEEHDFCDICGECMEKYSVE